MTGRKEFATPVRQIDADGALLDAVVSHPGLAADTRQRFVDMQTKLKIFIGLTDRQRAWVQREAAALGLPVPKVEKLAPQRGPSAWDPGSTKTMGSRVLRAVRALDRPAENRKGNRK